LVTQARQPALYTACAIPDTVDGRFEMIALHAFLVMRRLKGGGEDEARFAQNLFDFMFADMDRNLRELGVGDLGVGKRIKAMAKSFYGRIAAYEQGLAAETGVLEAALLRTVYDGAAVDSRAVSALADYLRRTDQALAAQPLSALQTGQVTFAVAADAA
jgi:cytochrome b pre-mRNA-processing protein 3